jgi:5-methylcytosine-specific restriction protein B
MEFFVQPNGSLFKLTKGEYDFIMDIIRDTITDISHST